MQWRSCGGTLGGDHGACECRESYAVELAVEEIVQWIRFKKANTFGSNIADAIERGEQRV